LAAPVMLGSTVAATQTTACLKPDSAPRARYHLAHERHHPHPVVAKRQPMAAATTAWATPGTGGQPGEGGDGTRPRPVAARCARCRRRRWVTMTVLTSRVSRAGVHDPDWVASAICRLAARHRVVGAGDRGAHGRDAGS